MWLIIGGNIEHVTGTITAVDIRVNDEVTGICQRLARFAAACETHMFPLFKSSSSATGVAATELEEFSAYSLPLVTDERKLHFEGDATAYCIIDLLEFDA